MSDELLDIVCNYQQYMNQPLCDLAEYYPEKFMEMCVVVAMRNNARGIKQKAILIRYIEDLMEYYVQQSGEPKNKVTAEGKECARIGLVLKHILETIGG